MKECQHEAIDKITKITSKTIVLIEPFRFANQQFLAKSYLDMNDFFSLGKKDLELNGFKIKYCFETPSKFYRLIATVIMERQ
jgi:hypothetical protein